MAAKSPISQLTRDKLFDVSHITAVVTGGGTGIGLMITQALVANGAKVYIIGRRAEKLEQVVQAHNLGPGSVHAMVGDVRQKSEALRLAKEIGNKEPNGIHLLVNNAGVTVDSTLYLAAGQPDMADPLSVSEHFLKLEEETWSSTFKTNSTAPFYMSMAFLPILARGKNVIPGYTSNIVNIGSIFGMTKGQGSDLPAYAASKGAIQQITRNLATLLLKCDVRVNAICPGIFPSQTTSILFDNHTLSEIAELTSIPAGRPGDIADMAATILFIVGPGGMFYNEQYLWPDGGVTLAYPSQR